MPNPTLSDLEAGKVNTTEIKPGGEQTQDLTEEQKKQAEAQKQQAEDKRIADLKAKAEDQLTTEEKTELESVLTKEQEAADKRLADLKAKDPNTLTDQEKAEIAAAEKANEGNEEDNEAGTFWDDVDKLRGEKLDIKYVDAQGKDVDPESPEGALIRERHLEQRAIEAFEGHLMKTDPRGYAYILHRQAGGTDEDFFARKTITLPEYETFKESVDLQQKIYRESLIRNGISEDDAKELVDKAVKDKKIFEKADKAYKDTETSQKADLDRIAKQLADEQQAYDDSVKSLDKMVTSEITSNASMKFIVPDSKKAAFTQFVKGHIEHANGKFFAVQEIDKDKLGRVLEGLYLQFVNGDISGLVQRTATTQNVRRLKRTIDKAKETPKSTEGEGAKPRKLTLGEL